MPFYTLTFDSPVIEFNASLQIGDIVYFCPSTAVGGFRMNTNITNMSDVTMIGELREINRPGVTLSNLVCWSDIALPVLPSPRDFIFFSKDNLANLGSLLGYVAEVEFTNNTRDKAELFSIGAEVSESSK